jgi:hypothetical protein
MKDHPNRLFTTSVTKEQAKDSGMAAVLILLLLGWFMEDNIFFKIAAVALLVDMVFPMFFYPFAIFWFGLGNLLGAVVSKILLSVIYLVVVLPMAIFRRAIGKDPLLLKKFKKDRESVMKNRHHLFRAGDLEKPY